MLLLISMQLLSPLMDSGHLLLISHGPMLFLNLFQRFLLSTGLPQKLVRNCAVL
jgi:hypothetical protein